MRNGEAEEFAKPHVVPGLDDDDEDDEDELPNGHPSDAGQPMALETSRNPQKFAQQSSNTSPQYGPLVFNVNSQSCSK